MNVNNITLISQSSERDFTQNPPEDSATSLSFEFNLAPSDGKPWPYEISLHSEVSAKDGDMGEANIPLLFRSDLQYAIQFDTLIEEKEIPYALSAAWPYVREGLIRQLQEHGIPSAPLVPISVTVSTEKTE